MLSNDFKEFIELLPSNGVRRKLKRRGYRGTSVGSDSNRFGVVLGFARCEAIRI